MLFGVLLRRHRDRQIQTQMTMVTERSSTVTRVAVLGAKGVGKTAIVVRFLTRRFLPEYQSGIETIYHHFKDGNDTKEIQIIDTCGNNDDLCSFADSIILVFSITNKQSFEYVKNLSLWLTKRRSKNAVFTIIGNKKDLSHKRQIVTAEAENFARSIAATYCEISAAIDIEPIRDVFQGLFLTLEGINRIGTPAVKRKKSKATIPTSEPKRKHSSIKDIFKKRPSV